MSELIDKACAKMDQMIDLCFRKIDTMRELKRALRLCQLLDVKPSEMPAGVRTTVTEGARMTDPWKGAVLQVHYATGEQRTFPLTDVHLELWPDELRERYTRDVDRKVKVAAAVRARQG